VKKIYFIRHAKAEEGADDLSRDLNERGKKDLALMCERLKRREVRADAIFSSHAKRCEKTAAKIANALKFTKKVKLKEELYETDSARLLSFINTLDEKFNNIFIIAHNNSIIEICESLSDSAIGNIPTCGVFCIEFNCSFNEIKECGGKALFFDYPKKRDSK